MHPRLLQLGHIALPTYAVFAALALVTALLTAWVVARRVGADPDKVWNMGLIATITAIAGSRLVLIATHFADFVAHPFWMLGLSAVRSPIALYGGILLGAAAGLLYAQANGLPLRRALDAVAPGLAVGAVLRDLGTFLAGMEFGAPTTLPWAVTYSSRIAGLWYGTPLGVRLHPVQLYSAAIQLSLLGFLLAWILHRRQDGELAAAWLFVTGLAGFLLEGLRGDAGRGVLLDGTLSAAQLCCIAMVVAGALMALERKKLAQHNATNEAEEEHSSLA